MTPECREATLKELATARDKLIMHMSIGAADITRVLKPLERAMHHVATQEINRRAPRTAGPWGRRPRRAR